jgi:prohibitin 2
MTRIRKIAAGLGCFILVLIAAIMFYFSRSEWIDAGHVGVVYNANGGLDRSHVRPPERVFIGWGQRLYQYPTMLQNAIYSQDPTEGEYKSADGVQVTTKDNQNTVFDISVIYRVRREDVFKAFDSFGAISIQDVQRLHIRRALKEAANNIGTQYDVFDLMGTKRLEASQKLTVEMQRLLSYKGISVELAMFCACEPTNDLQNKINARVNAYTDLQISKIRSQIAEIEGQTAVVLAEAQHQARQISAAKTQGSSLEMLQLQTDQAAIERWNGELPPIQQAPGQTIVIGSGEMDRIVGASGGRDK